MMVGLRAKLLMPVVAIALIWGAYVVMFDARAVAPTTLFAALVVLVAIMAANVELLVLRPLRALLASVQDLVRRFPASPPIDAPANIQQLASALDRLRIRLQEHEARFREEQARRERLEQNVREIEDRYALTVERANDGIWEWNVKSGAVDFSVRWKALVGQLDAALHTIEDWQRLLHPQERDLVVKRLQDHLDGHSAHFDEEYRVWHGNGDYRWIHSRGTAIRHANGKPYRVVVMDNDVHARKQIEQSLIEAAEALSSVSGNDFYRALMQSLASILGTRDNLVCYCVGDPPTHAHTLAYYSGGAFTENFEYELAGTSCGAVIERGGIVYVPTGAGNVWPLERQYDRDSYIGVPMFDSSGKVIGHFACMDGGPMRHDLPHLALFRIFSVRAAAELERTLLRRELEEVRPGA